MRELQKEELVPLRDCLDELLDFIQELGMSNVPYFCKFVERMKDNLEICILVQYEGWERIEHILRRDWNAANHKLIGIPDFRICEECLSKKEQLDFQFIELTARIESYFVT